jgi:hypothetical protein
LTTLRVSRNPNGTTGRGLGLNNSNLNLNPNSNVTNPNGMAPTFDIFVEDTPNDEEYDFLNESLASASVPSMATLQTEEERKKENEAKVTKWNEGGLGDNGRGRARLGRGEVRISDKRISEERTDELILSSVITNNLLLVASLLAG